MTTLVTGATGLLGGAVVAELLGHDTEVIALVRDADRAATMLDRSTVRLVEGDITHVEGWAAALRGVDTVIACAAYFREYYQPGHHQKALRSTNVDALCHLVRAADRANVPTVVHTSTIGVTGPTTAADGLSDEACPPDESALRNGYHRSKWEAEQALITLLNDVDVRVPIIRPGWLFGPGDAAPTASGRLVLDIARGKLPAIPAGGNHATDARDVAAAVVTAALKGRSGRCYQVAAPWQPMNQIVATLAAAAQTRPPRLQMPAPLSLGLGAAAEQLSKITGRPPLATRDGMAALLEPRRVSAARAINELDATFRPFTETARDAVAWYRHTDRLPTPHQTTV